MAQENPPTIADHWIAFRDSIDPKVYAFGRHAFETLAREGAPTVAQSADAAGLGHEEGRQAAAQLSEWGLMAVDANEKITAAYGLSVEPTDYRLELDGRTRYAWCALDALGIPAGLGADARVVLPVRGAPEPVVATFAKGRLAGPAPKDLVLSLPDPRLDADVRREVCPEIALHPRASAPRHERVALLDVEQTLALGRRMWGPVG